MMFLCCLFLIPAVDFFAILHFPFESMIATPSKVSVDVDRTPYSPLYINIIKVMNFNLLVLSFLPSVEI